MSVYSLNLGFVRLEGGNESCQVVCLKLLLTNERHQLKLADWKRFAKIWDSPTACKGSGISKPE